VGTAGDRCPTSAPRELPIGSGLQGPAVTLLDGSLSKRTDALALQLEAHALSARDRSLVGAYRAAVTLGMTDTPRTPG